MRKIIIIVLSCIALCVIGFFIYATIVTFGSQRAKEFDVPEDLKKLEKEIQIETHSADYTSFYRIEKQEIDNCKITLMMNLNLTDDSYRKPETANKYVISVKERINQKLSNKRCFDSIVLIVNSINTSGLEVSERYSFPVKK
jgi:uncharacterized protein YxeA